MMFHDPRRNKLANWRPCWLESLIALPSFQLEPHLTDPSLVTITICHGGRGAWLSKDIPLSQLLQTFSFWSEDPEGTFMKLFGLNDWPKQFSKIELVKQKQTTGVKVNVPVEDLI